MKITVFVLVIVINIALIIITRLNESRQEQYEAGKKFARDSILNTNDSLLYTGIPDTISYKPELKNGGSYKIKGKGM